MNDKVLYDQTDEYLREFVDKGLGPGPQRKAREMSLPSRRNWRLPRLASAVAAIMLISSMMLVLLPRGLATERIAQVIPGPTHTLFITYDNILWGTGSNELKQLGIRANHPLINQRHPDGTRYTTKPVKIMARIVEAAAGYDYSLMLRDDGTLWASGSRDSLWFNAYKTLEEQQMPNMAPTQIMTDVRHIASGYYHALIVKNDGSLWGLGVNMLGQLGVGWGTDVVLTAVPEPIEILSGGVNTVFTGAASSFILMDDGRLLSCGGESSGELGYKGSSHKTSTIRSTGPDTVLSINYPPKLVMENVQSVAGGTNHSIILGADGVLWGTGSNTSGQLGLGSVVDSVSEPVRIMDDVRAIAAGDRFSLALKQDGSLWGMGSNWCGQLGASREFLPSPTHIMDDVVNAWATRDQVFVKLIDGSLLSMGRNDYGQLIMRKK